MYQGKHSAAVSSERPRHSHAAVKRSRAPRMRRSPRAKLTGLLVALVLLLSLSIGGTLAWLSSSDTLSNSIDPGAVPIQVDLANGGAQITNLGNIHAFVRVAAISNTLDAGGNIVPAGFSRLAPSNGGEWTEIGGFYYYNAPLAPNASVSFSGVGGVQGTEVNVMAQSVQALGGADGMSASRKLWGVSYTNGAWGA